MEKLRIGIAHGDVNGIGYELIIKMLSDNKICELFTPVLFGSSKIAAYYRKSMKVDNFSLNNIQKPQDANKKRCNVINCINDEVKVEPGVETKESDEAAMTALRQGLDAVSSRKVDVLVAAPQRVSSYCVEGTSGCQDYLSKYFDVNNIMPFLIGEKVKIGFVSCYTPFNKIMQEITRENIVNKIKIMEYSLINDFMIEKPRIAVLSLNPYIGKGHKFGNEEYDVIIPSIESARELGIMALGPYNADQIFKNMDYSKFDAVLALYHDQGMIPFKSIEGNRGVMLMAGLPYVITTTVHGTAYDIVTQNKGDETALRNAAYVAIDVYRNRQINKEINANPLSHYDVSSNTNETDLNVEQIAGVRDDYVEEDTL